MIRLLLAFALLSLTLGCAHMVAPTGGTGDITPPHFISSSPQSGATSIPLESEIEIQFSEWITPKSAKSAVMLFPLIDSGVTIDVKTRSIKISPRQPLKANQTYQVVLSRDIMDFANNGLKKSELVVFSTGTILDSGVIKGCIPPQFYTDSLLPKVALFEAQRIAQHDSLLLGPVDYLAQTDRHGFFTFNAIQQSSYICIGFIDQNRDNRITPLETVFLARQKGIVTNGPAVTLFPASSDTTRDHIVAVKIPFTNTLIATLSRPVSKNPFVAVEITPLTDSTETVAAPLSQKVVTQLLDSLTLKITLPFSLVSTKRYRLTTTGENLFTGSGAVATYTDTIENRGNLTIDTVAPKATKVSWNLQNPQKPLLIIQWDAPVTVQEGATIIVVDSTLRNYTFPIISQLGNTTTAQPQEALPFKNSYKPTIPDSLVRGYNGMFSQKDTTPYLFKIPSQEDFSTELLLRFPTHEAIPFPIISWEIHQKEVTYKSKSGVFPLILTGYYTPTAFFDLNGNGTFETGTLFPYKSGDVAYHFTDSVKSVARFSVEHAVEPLIICEEPKAEMSDSVITAEPTKK